MAKTQEETASPALAPVVDATLAKVRHARNRGVPLIAITTTDQPDLVGRLVIAAANGATPILVYDVVRGLRPGASDVSPNGSDVSRDAFDRLVTAAGGSPADLSGPLKLFEVLAARASDGKPIVPPKTQVVLVAGDRILSEPDPAVALLMSREFLENNGIAVISVGARWKPAAELGRDFHEINDAPPDAREREVRVRKYCLEQGIEVTDRILRDAGRYTRGLSRFALSQAISLSLIKGADGKPTIDSATLRAVWRASIDAMQCLTVLDDTTGDALAVGGYPFLREFARDVCDDAEPPECFVVIDEIEKVFAGRKGDNTGITQAIVGMMLTYMQGTQRGRKPVRGIILVGPSGTGKTKAATTFGTTGGVPTIMLDPNAGKSSDYGASESAARESLDALEAISGGSLYFIATCNELEADTLPPEFQARFTDGVIFVDLPDGRERVEIFTALADAMGLDAKQRDWDQIDHRGYVGRDVYNLVAKAARDKQRRPVGYFARSYVASSLGNRKVIESLRRQAVGSWMSASYPGPYRMPGDEAPAQTTTARKINLDEEG